MIKFELSGENQNFGESVYTTMSLTASQYLKTSYKISGNINECGRFYMVNCVNIYKIYITQ